MPTRIALLLALTSSPLAVLSAQEPPFVVRCGVSAAGAGADSWGSVLPDLPFSPERGYGHVGGGTGRALGAAIRGGESGWPASWREGPVKYSFRLPRGEYLVRLGFLETEVAQPGLRVFDVDAEDEEALAGLDIFAEAGDFTWLTRAFLVSVQDGWLDLRLVSVTGARAPRLARIGVSRLVREAGAPPSPPVPALSARPGPLENVLAWDDVFWPGLAGYGIFRAEASEGPFESLTSRPLRAPRFVDAQVAAGTQYYYKVRAFGIEGGQSPFSAAAAAAPLEGQQSGLKLYHLRLAGDALARMSVESFPAVQVPAELEFYGNRFTLELSYDTAAGLWQARKSLHLDMSQDRHRLLRRRDLIVLSAEAGDPTGLRELCSAEAAALAGLTAAEVEPVTVMVNGRFLGLRYEIERLDDRFRRRARLDQVGILARLDGDDHWRADWEPRGTQLGKRGDLVALNELIHQLNRLHEGEAEAFFEDHFYLDRFIDGLALAAARGELNLSPSRLHLLRDSRNGKWELFRQQHESGDWGIRDFSPEPVLLSEEEARRALFPAALLAGRPPARDWLALFTRFFAVEPLRERYLTRLEALLEGELSPAGFEALVDRAFERIRAAALLDHHLWPFDGGATFLAGPEKLKECHRRRVDVLRQVIAEERRRRPEPIVIAATLLWTAAGAPWVELLNRSAEPRSLAGYILSPGLAIAAGQALSSARPLAPGERLRVPIAFRGGSGAAPEGGLLVLWRRGEEGQSVLADLHFYGHQTAGFSYRRAGAAGWGFFAEDGASDSTAPLEAPHHVFRQGVHQERSGDLTLWFQGGSRGPGLERPEKVELRYREEGAAAFETVEMGWDEQRFRWALSLEKSDSRPRTAYYFLATATGGVERAYPLGAPALTYFLPERHELYINEVCPRPIQGPDSPGEFIEIHNESSRAVSLRGMYLTDDRRVPTKWRIREDVVVPPKGYALFYADGLNRGNHTSFRLSNSGEYVGLYGPIEEGNLPIDGIVFRGVPAGQSWGRKQDGTRGFRSWRDPTPGRQNLPKIPEEFLRGERESGPLEIPARDDPPLEPDEEDEDEP